MAATPDDDAGRLAAPGVDRFGDVAVELGLLTAESLERLLGRQKRYREMGITMRLDEIAVEIGVMARVDCNVVLRELQKRRKISLPPPKTAVSGADSSFDLVVPCRLGEFEVEERVGGGMGTVYKAFDRRSQRHVALKMLPHAFAADKQTVERFQREARAASRLSHPNMVTFFDAGTVEGRPYISMEYVEGEPLTAVLEREGRLSERDALRIGRELAFALYHVHVNGLVHRDVKPENAIVDLTGRVRLTDLGLAKLLDETQRLTGTGTAVGTPYYISPEQARGDEVVDRRADLYGLGATLYHLICGHPPFEGTVAEVLRKQVYEAPPDPAGFAPEISPLTRNLLLRLLAKDPAQRLQGADELIAVLDKILGNPSTHLGKAGVVAKPVTGAVPAVPAAQPPLAPAPPRKTPPAPSTVHAQDAPTGDYPTVEGLMGLEENP